MPSEASSSESCCMFTKAVPNNPLEGDVAGHQQLELQALDHRQPHEQRLGVVKHPHVLRVDDPRQVKGVHHQELCEVLQHFLAVGVEGELVEHAHPLGTHPATDQPDGGQGGAALPDLQLIL